MYGGQDMSRLENTGGPVDSDVSYFRDADGLIYYAVREYVTCHTCGSGEVYQPMQAMDLPMLLQCLKCGVVAPTDVFKHSGDA